MIERVVSDFDLGQIMRSGQCFRMNDLGGGHFSLVAYGRYLELEQCGQTIRFSCDAAEFDTLWRQYFDLDADYERYKKAVPASDSYLRKAISFGGGIRILRQELWETLVTFIISQRSTITRIRNCVSALASLYGETRLNANGQPYNVFPTEERLAALSVDDLAPVRLGYRARYIAETARQAASGEINLNDIARMGYEDAHAALMRFSGVGRKVADCVCLFALHHINAFPIDTHMRRMLETQYPEGFPLERYQGFAGILQQYSFYYEVGIMPNSRHSKSTVFNCETRKNAP